MRKLILFMVLSLDGFVCGENDELDWEVNDPSVGAYLVPAMLPAADALLLGSNLFEGFSKFWPPAVTDASLPQELRDFARWICETPKIAFSGKEKQTDWEHSRYVQVSSDEDLAQKVREIKGQDGKDIIVYGGARFAQTLVALGLVDEFHFKIQPIFLGAGKALFAKAEGRTQLKLVRSKAFDSGVVASVYVPGK